MAVLLSLGAIVNRNVSPRLRGEFSAKAEINLRI